jgi:hypothetical protein
MGPQLILRTAAALAAALLGGRADAAARPLPILKPAVAAPAISVSARRNLRWAARAPLVRPSGINGATMPRRRR